MKTLTALILLAITLGPLSYAADSDEYEVRQKSARYSKEKPKPSGPEAQAIAFLELIKKRDFATAKKEFFAKSMTDKNKKKWEVVNLTFAKHYRLDRLRNWRVASDKNDIPMVDLLYYQKNGGTMNLMIPMTKEDGVWKVAGFH